MKRILAPMFLFLFFTGHTKADSWTDPTWKQMLDSSHVVALISYTSSGDFRAKAKIITLYKGSLKAGDEIWISGFSNRYGPIDKVKRGDKYLVFIRLNRPTENGKEYWRSAVAENSELKDYYDAYLNNTAYYIWTPTSGDLNVKGSKVQYDLVQSTFYKKQTYFSLKEFEAFLSAYYQPSNKGDFCKELLKRIQASGETQDALQSIMMLSLMGYDQYDPIFERYSTSEKPSFRYAIAQLMGVINSEQSRQILVNLIEDDHSLVQGEAVRQLADAPREFVGPVLTRHLGSASSQDHGPSNIMNPVRNTIDGGKSQMIRTLGDIGYKEAIPELVSLLETTDKGDFKLVVATLKKLGSRDYIPYINKHLRNLEDKMILDLCFIIAEDSLTECIPSLMYYVENHDRTKWPAKEYTISTYHGLAKFPQDTVKNFLLKDFHVLLKSSGTNEGSVDPKKSWVDAYLETFNELGITVSKAPLYDFMFRYYGFDSKFRQYPETFQSKKKLEDSLVNVSKQLLKGTAVSDVQALAFINYDGHKPTLLDYTLKITIASGSVDEIIDALAEGDISKEHAMVSKGSTTHTFGAKFIERFGDSLMTHFLEYISANADKEDIAFMINLKNFNYPTVDYERKTLEKYLQKATEK